MYDVEQLRAMADRHDRYSACTMPARDHFADVCREYAAVREHLAQTGVTIPDHVIPLGSVDDDPIEPDAGEV